MSKESAEPQEIINALVAIESSIITFASRMLQAENEEKRRALIESYNPDEISGLKERVKAIGKTIGSTPIACNPQIALAYNSFCNCSEDCINLTKALGEGSCTEGDLKTAMYILQTSMDGLEDIIRKAAEESDMERIPNSNPPAAHDEGPCIAQHLSESHPMNNRSAQERLLVIGNGFDLNHGLPTQFSDFRNYLKEHHPDDLRYIEDDLADGDPDAFWSDVEVWLG